MQAQTMTPTRRYQVGRGDAEAKVREMLGGAGVRRVTVSDTHGHTIIEVPVRAEDVGLVMEPVLAATKAVADTVGEVVLSVEAEGELPSRATGAQQPQGGGGQQPTAAVTEQDIERIRKANAVPTATAEDVKRIAPEQEGEPELKDTGEWPDVRQDGK